MVLGNPTMHHFPGSLCMWEPRAPPKHIPSRNCSGSCRQRCTWTRGWFPSVSVLGFHRCDWVALQQKAQTRPRNKFPHHAVPFTLCLLVSSSETDWKPNSGDLSLSASLYGAWTSEAGLELHTWVMIMMLFEGKHFMLTTRAHELALCSSASTLQRESTPNILDFGSLVAWRTVLKTGTLMADYKAYRLDS